MNQLILGTLIVIAFISALMLEYVTRPEAKKKPKSKPEHKPERRANGQYKRRIPVNYAGGKEYIYL